MATRHYADHGAEEESYFASMTDVFIGLLFIFIIMLMFFAMRFQEATEKQKVVTRKQDEATQLQSEVTKKQNELIDELTDSETARLQVLESIGSSLKKQGLDVFIVRDEGILRLPEKMLFAKSNWELGTKGVDAAKTLKALGDALDEVLPCYTLGSRSRHDNCPKTKAKIEAIFIEGHADADVYQRRSAAPVPQASGSSASGGGSVFSIFRRDSPPAISAPPSDNRSLSTATASSTPPKDNLDLSALRATSTFRELMRVKKELGLYENAHGKPILSVSGYGEFRPLAPEPGESADSFKQRNRRIDLRILMASPRSDDARKIESDLQGRDKRQ